ncbi:Glutamine amidotransferase subunit pdxT [uncultured Blautia sp.]|uniref:pyridoxal 5'-phosphate synthase glutaminase subunit PdxT n=1 Tax=Blautia TaxID=572511 RepID=UPI000820AAEA|nr:MULTISPECIES: pyridoxal 5'-phosphate synthase glutaminase subunit PdxT [Blautia]MCU6773157.1 pyridoxal 5'-phosphate synthase glutaminase subunit PdxT [Blautia acetigignens]NSL03338.1 pyridoxal 5'-phosphate synthase glutaminase subunit PdxT [Blautia glucerasea]SCG95009.1 Glutamine amidotransferase subunit pdxT [uncultured Blautia sp.]
MKIGILAVQGAFAEHRAKLEKLGAQCVELRKKEDLESGFDGLVLPGGESTVQGKLLRELDMFQPLKEKIEAGMPVLATCAGLILLADHLSNDEHVYFGTMPVTVKRNAYGRQLGSFHTIQEMKGMGEVPMTFIRAPYIEKCEEGAEVLAEIEGNIVAVKYKEQYGLAFHPELDEDDTIHSAFLESIKKYKALSK